MINTFAEVKGEIRSLIGDPDGDFATDAYLTPLVNIVQKKAVNYLEGTCSPFITKIVDVPNIPAGYTSFIKEQKAGGTLVGLFNPLIIEFKQAGMPINTYCEAIKTNRLPNIAPDANPTTRGMYWEMRSFVLYLTPLTYIADFQVRGEFRPAPLLLDDDIIAVHPMLSTVLAFGTAALIGAERGNQSYVTNYQPQAEQILEDVASELVRQQQGPPTRLGKMNRTRGFLRIN